MSEHDNWVTYRGKRATPEAHVGRAMVKTANAVASGQEATEAIAGAVALTFVFMTERRTKEQQEWFREQVNAALAKYDSPWRVTDVRS
jgi:hypothetical protein